MSGFDKEAERERLREKYERDREKRAATQRMSELLLQGATMTNSHCDDCGDPIFRYDGQEFCPTCQGEDGDAADGENPEAASGGADATAAEGADAARAGGTDTAASDEADSAETRTPATDADGADSPTGTADPSPSARSSPADATRDRRTPPSADPDGSSATPDAARVRDLVEGDVDAAPGDRDVTDPVGAARASLSRTLVGYARAAEETDDPRRATELLGTAREAAETLAALDRLR